MKKFSILSNFTYTHVMLFISFITSVSSEFYNAIDIYKMISPPTPFLIDLIEMQ